MRGGKVCLSPVTGAEGAEGIIARRRAEAIGVIGVEAVASDRLEGGRL